MNQDFSQSVAYKLNSVDWEASPAKGVWRKKLDRQEAESGRATSVVKYEPGSAFRTHTHDGGEEILVLDGVFSDETGDYHNGTYFRNPPGTSHAPFSESGCEIFVKLCHFQKGDDKQIALSIDGGPWLRDANNNEYNVLHQYKDESTCVYRLDKDAELHTEPLIEREVLVIDGEVRVGEQPYPALSWIRLAKHDKRSLIAMCHTKLLVKTGHLSHLETE